MERTEIALGHKYRDRMSGFEGIATGRHEYLNGCMRVTLSSTELREGKPVEGQSFDSEDLVFVDNGVASKAKPTGGPGDVPKPRLEPKGR